MKLPNRILSPAVEGWIGLVVAVFLGCFATTANLMGGSHVSVCASSLVLVFAGWTLHRCAGLLTPARKTARPRSSSNHAE